MFSQGLEKGYIGNKYVKTKKKLNNEKVKVNIFFLQQTWHGQGVGFVPIMCNYVRNICICNIRNIRYL